MAERKCEKILTWVNLDIYNQVSERNIAIKLDCDLDIGTQIFQK